jgi:hypothetical protein
MGILFWCFPYIVFSAACDLMLPASRQDSKRRQLADLPDRAEDA